MGIIRSLLSWIFSIIVAIILFGLAIIYIPMQTHTIQKVELTYIFVDDSGNKYNILNEGVHGAADDWAFLFEDNNKESRTGKVDGNTGYLDDKDYVLNNDNLKKIVDKNIDKNIDSVLEDNIEDNIEDIIDENSDNIKNEKEDIIQKKLDEIKDDCITPWNNVIKDGEYVLAYQQRADVPTICNVQKRSCHDGTLNGAYTQASCREDIKYEYTKVKVISLNNKKPGEFIQTPENAKNDSAIFDTDGKINQNIDEPNTNWDNTHNQPIVNNSSTNLTHKNYYNCTTPWGEIVGHGQFVKAYKLPLGFIDQKCQVELRLCLDGILKGQSSYKTCEYKDMTYQDYIADNNDITNPTPDLMVDTLININKKNRKSRLSNLFGKLF